MKFMDSPTPTQNLPKIPQLSSEFGNFQQSFGDSFVRNDEGEVCVFFFLNSPLLTYIHKGIDSYNLIVNPSFVRYFSFLKLACLVLSMISHKTN